MHDKSILETIGRTLLIAKCLLSTQPNIFGYYENTTPLDFIGLLKLLYQKIYDLVLMIFDEATSSLDSKNEEAILKTFYSFKGKMTIVIIAHRLSTGERCDSLIWIEKGAIKMRRK